MTAVGDLATPTDVHHLVTRFYREIVFDDLLEPVFGEVAEVDWAQHIPKLIDYWCWILFGTGGQGASVTKVHRHLHGQSPIESEHCDRWFALWALTIDAGWSGPHADHAKAHAEALMAGMAKHIFGYTWTAPDPTAAHAADSEEAAPDAGWGTETRSGAPAWHPDAAVLHPNSRGE